MAGSLQVRKQLQKKNTLGSMRRLAPAPLDYTPPHRNSIHQRNQQPPPEILAQYNQEQENVGRIQSIKGEELVLREHVYSTLWSKVKFVLCDSELDYEGKIARSVLKGVTVDPEFKREYWARNRQKVLKWINQKRNNTIGAVKREFIRWALSMINEEKKEPTLDMLKNHRGGDASKFALWANLFFRGGYGTVQFRSVVSEKKISDILSVYDEAFIICVIHNAFDRWVYEAKMISENGTIDKEKQPPTKWTDTGTAARKYEGWDEAGITFFNQTVQELMKLRDTKVSRDLEKAFRKEKKNQYDEKKRGGVKRVSVVITAMNGLDDEEEEEAESETMRSKNIGRMRKRVSVGSQSETTASATTDGDEEESIEEREMIDEDQDESSGDESD